MGQIIEKSDLFTISILGEFSSGKSTLVNAIFLQDDVLPMHQGVCTPTLTEILYGEKDELTIGNESYLGIETIKDALSRNVKNCASDLKKIVLRLNKEELKELRIIDTPGLNSPDKAHSDLTKEIIDSEISSLVLWVIDLNSGATESAIILLERLRNANYKCVLIANQIDSIAKNGGKEAIDSAVRSLKEKAYMFPDIYPVCALDSLKGIKNNNPKLVEKSRTPELLAFITEEKSKRQSNAAVLKKKKDYLNLQIKCYNEFIDKKEATRNGLERYIIREALPSLEKRFCDVGFKDTLARCIQDRIEAIEVSPTFNVYKFLLEVKNDTLMYVNALLLVHISNCLGGYAEDIKKKCATELEKFIPEEYQLLPDVSLPDMPGSPDSVNPISEVLKNIIKSMTGLILAIGAGISSLFVTTTTTSLIFFSTTVWNPLGIASIIFFLALSIVTFKSISSPNKKVRENLKSSMKEKFGVNGVNSDDCYSKEGIINMIWNGGRFEEAKDKTGWFSKTTMMITDAGRKLKEEMEKPPALKTVMQEKHIRWAMNQLEISYTERQKIQSEIMMALEETSDVLNEKNNTLPSLRDERRNDFKRIWEGLEPDGTRIKLPNGKYMEGISSELDKIITDIDRRITLLKEEIVSTRS